MNSARRVLLEPAFLLHQRDYRDSSRIIEFFTRDCGRVCLFAKGVRRAGGSLAAVLQPFVPLLLSWSGPGDGGTLTAAELTGPPLALPRPALMSAFYLNELVLRLVAREDPHPDIHESYTLALAGLADPGGGSRALRLFEKRLLDALGLGLDYARVAGSGEPVQPGAYYHVRAERGVVCIAAQPDPATDYRGEELLSLAAEELADAASLAAAKRLLRSALAGPLDGRELTTRTVARAVRADRAGRARPAGATDTGSTAEPAGKEGSSR
jgi:DNA repair protein RecO (recombination protein O)